MLNDNVRVSFLARASPDMLIPGADVMAFKVCVFTNDYTNFWIGCDEYYKYKINKIHFWDENFLHNSYDMSIFLNQQQTGAAVNL